jgi:tetratricopeptide (TPR) repeat protein
MNNKGPDLIRAFCFAIVICSMYLDADNAIVELCVKGLEEEGKGNTGGAKIFYQQAWDAATNQLEAFTAAHYLARQQDTKEAILQWNIKALEIALTVDSDTIKGAFASLYLNVANAYEQLADQENAVHYYKLAAEAIPQLTDDGYGKMIQKGIEAGLNRVQN